MKKTEEQRAADAIKKIKRLGRQAIKAHKTNIGRIWEELSKADISNRPALMDAILQEQHEIDKITGLVDDDTQEQ